MHLDSFYISISGNFSCWDFNQDSQQGAVRNLNTTTRFFRMCQYDQRKVW